MAANPEGLIPLNEIAVRSKNFFITDCFNFIQLSRGLGELNHQCRSEHQLSISDPQYTGVNREDY